MKHANQIGIFATKNCGIFNIGISVATRSWAYGGENRSHVGIVYRFEDGSYECFEAAFSRGFEGPFPLEDLFSWRSSGWSRFYKGFHIAWMPVFSGPHILDDPGDTIQLSYLKALEFVKSKTPYGKKQILSLLMFERFGKRVKRDPSKLICSEAVALLVDPPLTLTDARHSVEDEVTPASAWANAKLIIKQTGEARLPFGVVRNPETIKQVYPVGRMKWHGSRIKLI